MSGNYALTVYYDGLCRVCAAEIEHYMRHPRASRVRWADITSPNFDATAEGLDPEAIHLRMHVRRADGRVHAGVDSFLAIWETLETLPLLRAVVGFRPLRPLMDLGYEAFARVRPYLPKRRRSEVCDDGLCDPAARRERGRAAARRPA
jgi:predicted DCC family thiol-disulfide oxidoreductase YuxK